MSDPREQQPVVLDAESPWPGLHEFDERGREFFNGRDAEVADLLRLVGNAPLTVLFGASGLGKTSLLLAGLQPALRVARKLPVYVRLDARDRRSPLVEQARGRLFAEFEACKVEHPRPKDGESLWQYLHRADLEFWSRDNQLLTPVFIFDQFEEVFTLGGDNADAVRQLRDDLADLIENRVPAALAQRLEARDPDLAAVDILSQRCKLVLSFREDFLPDIEEWRRAMPSLARNRLRLLPMNGLQAYDAVLMTGGRLVDLAVSEAIVNFVAAAQSRIKPGVRAAEPGESASAARPEVLASLTIEPALLSLVCTGLNDRRRAVDKPAIDSALLTGTGQAIVTEFYERCVRDIPPQTRRFIEDRLITEGGYRETYPKSDALDQGYISEADLTALVDRRLLRVEPHLGVPRIELVHDLMTSVVRRSRDAERERQREAAAAERDQRYRRRQYGLALVTLISLVLGVMFYLQWTKAETAFTNYKLEEQKRRGAEAAQIAAQTALAQERTRNESIKALEDADQKRTSALSLASRTQYAQALKLLNEALVIYRRVDDRNRAGRTLVDRGKIYALDNNYDRAAADFAALLDDASLQAPELRALAIEAQASLEERRENAAKALDLHTQAFKWYELAGDPLAAARILEWMATKDESLGHFDRAVANFTLALARYEIAGDTSGSLRCRQGIARTAAFGYLVNLKTNKVYPLRGYQNPSAWIGRDSPEEGINNDISFANPFISRLHLIISQKDFRALDLRSRNGTSINGKMWPYGAGRKLENGDIVTLANVEALQFFRSAPGLPARPLRAWGILIDGSPKQPIYLTEASYSLQMSGGQLNIEAGASDTAVASVRFADGKIEIMAHGGEWGVTFISKESDYEYVLRVFPSGQWLDFHDLPPMKIAKLSPDRKTIVTDGPSFQIVAITGE